LTATLQIANTRNPDSDDLLGDHFRYWIVSINHVKQAQGALVSQVEPLSFLRGQLTMPEQSTDGHKLLICSRENGILTITPTDFTETL
jgi:hypothetical protein